MKNLFEMEKSSGYYSPSDDESSSAEKSVPYSPILKSPSMDKDPTVSEYKIAGASMKGRL